MDISTCKKIAKKTKCERKNVRNNILLLNRKLNKEDRLEFFRKGVNIEEK